MRSENRLENILSARRSVRRFSDKALSPELVEEVLDAARWAPSPHNSQPWRFAVISTADGKERLARAMGNKFAQDLRNDKLEQGEIDRRVESSFHRISSAPVVVTVCLVETNLKTYPDKRQSFERSMAVQCIGAAIQNILLSCQDRALGACWLGSPLFCQDIVKETLQLDATWQPQALVLIGYPSSVPKAPQRFELHDLAVYR